jgi:hypothetical protein
MRHRSASNVLAGVVRRLEAELADPQISKTRSAAAVRQLLHAGLALARIEARRAEQCRELKDIAARAVAQSAAVEAVDAVDPDPEPEPEPELLSEFLAWRHDRDRDREHQPAPVTAEPLEPAGVASAGAADESPPASVTDAPPNRGEVPLTARDLFREPETRNANNQLGQQLASRPPVLRGRPRESADSSSGTWGVRAGPEIPVEWKPRAPVIDPWRGHSLADSVAPAPRADSHVDLEAETLRRFLGGSYGE